MVPDSFACWRMLSAGCTIDVGCVVCLGQPHATGSRFRRCRRNAWEYYRQLRHYQDHPDVSQQQQLSQRFDDIFGRRYRHHAGLNQVLQQFCAHKPELLRVLETPQLPLHTNAAEADIREYVTRRKISGGTRHADGRRARDTFTGLKKTCRKLSYSFWQYLLSRLHDNHSVPHLPDVIRSRATTKAALPVP